MPESYNVAIVYRPFTITDPALMTTIATETSIQFAYDAIAAAGFHVEVLRVGDDIRKVLSAIDRRKTVLFNYCDGFIDDPTGYDPITQLFEELGFAFTGARDATLVSSIDKSSIKVILEQYKIPTPAYRVCENQAPDDWHRYPAIVKPAMQHGSFGITRDSVVDTLEQIEQQVKLIYETWKQPALVEDFIDGTEYRVSVWGNDEIEVLPLMGIQFANDDHHERLKSFVTKWADDELSTPMRIEVPAKVDSDVRERIEQAAIAAYRVLDMRDYGGIDVRVRDGQPYIIDANANADISEVSNFLRAARAAGHDYSTMLGKIVRLAAQRLPQT